MFSFKLGNHKITRFVLSIGRDFNEIKVIPKCFCRIEINAMLIEIEFTL